MHQSLRFSLSRGRGTSKIWVIRDSMVVISFIEFLFVRSLNKKGTIRLYLFDQLLLYANIVICRDCVRPSLIMICLLSDSHPFLPRKGERQRGEFGYTNKLIVPKT